MRSYVRSEQACIANLPQDAEAEAGLQPCDATRLICARDAVDPSRVHTRRAAHRALVVELQPRLRQLERVREDRRDPARHRGQSHLLEQRRGRRHLFAVRRRGETRGAGFVLRVRYEMGGWVHDA